MKSPTSAVHNGSTKSPKSNPCVSASDPILRSSPIGLFDQGIHVAFLSQLCNALPEAQGQLPFNQKQGDILCNSDPTNIDFLRTLKCSYSLDVNFTGPGIDVFEDIQQNAGFHHVSPVFLMGHPSF